MTVPIAKRMKNDGWFIQSKTIFQAIALLALLNRNIKQAL